MSSNSSYVISTITWQLGTSDSEENLPLQARGEGE